MSKKVASALVVACLLACAGASGVDAKLTFRSHGSVLRFEGRPRVWCGPWADDVARPALHVALTDTPRRGWTLDAVRRDLRVGEPIRFPLDFVFDGPRGAQLFVADGRRIEASSAEEESSGSLTFTHAGCRRGALVAFTIDAALGSEYFQGGRVGVTGSFRGRVSSAPRPAR
jgi:hypothetical protein